MSQSDNEDECLPGEEEDYVEDEEMVEDDEEYEYCEDDDDEQVSNVSAQNNHFDYFINPTDAFLQDHPHVQSYEFRHILQTLKYIMKQCTTYKLSLDWELEHLEKFRYPAMTVTSRAKEGVSYFFVLNFRTENGVTFPEVPPRIIPNFSMSPALYLFTVNFPLLSQKHWNPCQDFISVLEIMFNLWDQVLVDYQMYEGSIAGGDVTEFPLNKEAVAAYVNRGHDSCSVEIITALWYELFQYECGYEFKDIEVLLNGFMHGSEGSGSNQIISTSMHSVLAACPKPVVQKQYDPMQGVGYSTGRSEKGEKRMRLNNTSEDEKLTVKFAKICTIKIQERMESGDMLRILRWVFASPLINIVAHILSCLSPGDALRNVNEILSLLLLIYTIEDAAQRSNAEIPLASRHLLKSVYITAKRMWIDTNLLVEEGSQDDPSTVLSEKAEATCDNVITSIQKFSLLWKEVNEELTESTGSSSSSSNIAHTYEAMGVPSAETESTINASGSRVIFVDGLEADHHFRVEGTKIAKCPKFFLRELKTFEQSLAEEITLFVSESSPHLIRALMHVINDDCPYFGGCFMFDILIPADYPNVNPNVHFLTTGNGTVRFNPNLYNCGKVCLSLLGTWQGEPWDPKTSNLTQVLNSILFLIFTKDPYFNEPGYVRTELTAQDSLRYDAKLFNSVVDFAIKTHLKSPNRIPQIQNTIFQIYRSHWHTRILPILRKMLAEFQAKTSSNEVNVPRLVGDLEEISKLVAKMH